MRILFVLTLCALAWPVFAAEPVTRLDRENLLEFRDDNGRVAPVRSLSDWHRRRAEILAGMQQVMGPLPGPEKRVPLDVRVEEEKDFGTYVRRRITYQAEPGSRVPAHLFIPKDALAPGARLRSGVLCLMGTSGHRHADTPPGPNFSGNQNDAEALVARGYVAISPPYPTLGFGGRSGIGIKHDPDLKALGYASGTMKAIWDNIRALDVLETLPFVKRSGFATIGTSLGGHNSIYTASFEPRIKVVVSSCGFDSLLDYYGGNIKGYVQERYMLKMADYLGRPQDVPWDYYELIAALAPRHVFVNAPLRDANFRHDSVDRIAAAAEPVFRLHEAGGRLIVRHPDSDHDFPDAERFEAYELIEKVLRSR
jgi:dienelactone hydrolase